MFTGSAIIFCVLIISTFGFHADRWLPPLNNVEMIRQLCTEFMHQHIILNVQKARDARIFLEPGQNYEAPIEKVLKNQILCRKNYNDINRRYEGIVWFMRALDFCDINRITLVSPLNTYHRDFQIDMLRAGFSLVCQKTDDIGKYQLSAFADLFRIIYEKFNVNRPIICNRLLDVYQDLYERCHVDANLANITIAKMKCQGGNDLHPTIKLRAFFSRFSRQCQSLPEFYQTGDKYDTRLGEALANDTVFMNMLSGHIKRTALSYSLLPHLVLKTRLLLQHFPLAAIKMKQLIEAGRKCKHSEIGHINLESDSSTNFSIDHGLPDENCKLRNIDDINTEMADEFVQLGQKSLIGVFVEVILLIFVVINSTLLTVLLLQTQDKLSTATILFIFNILFSNALFLASFVCMFSDFYDNLPYGEISEDQFTQSSAALIVAETLQTHLFAPSEFFKHLVQETLFSLAQNGSLLGLTHLLVLVLVVISKSMSGKAIRLSKRSVILVFAFVWAFLILTHLLFSALQFSAITNLDHMFAKLNSIPGSLDCSKPPTSDYREIGQKCDRVAVFHEFGVYLLRGHTLFTLTFLLVAIVVFIVTLLYHLRVRTQHDFLGDNLKDHSPYKRRETLFNTLLLSIGAFFISVLGQSFVEIAVFWVDDRYGVAHLATYYQLARILAFMDPLLNPVLVAVRTPTMRRRLRYYICLAANFFTMIFCPWKILIERRKRRTASINQRKRSAGLHRRPSSTTATMDSSKLDSSDSEVTLKLFCATTKFRSSLLRRSKSSMAASNSIV